MPISDANDVSSAAQRLGQGELVAFPTETVYGLGANAWDELAVGKIFVAKGRPATNPLIVHIADRSQLDRCVALPLNEALAATLDRLAVFWPGPLTLILPRSPRIPLNVTAGRDTVAVRVPDHPVAQRLLSACEFPIAAPSANRSTAVSPTTAKHVQEELGDRVSLILDGGPSRVGLESTIVSLMETPPRILRHGAITAEQIATALDLDVETLLRDESPKLATNPGFTSPGQMKIHYAPKTPVFLRTAPSIETSKRVGLIRFHSSSAAEESTRFAEVRTLSEHGDLHEIARSLFATLRELDRLDLELIVVDTCEESGLGRAIMDRLKRAAARASQDLPSQP